MPTHQSTPGSAAGILFFFRPHEKERFPTQRPLLPLLQESLLLPPVLLASQPKPGRKERRKERIQQDRLPGVLWAGHVCSPLLYSGELSGYGVLYSTMFSSTTGIEHRSLLLRKLHLHTEYIRDHHRHALRK